MLKYFSLFVWMMFNISSFTYSVSELLKKHGLEKPVSFVKSTQSSLEEARSLMVRLTRHTGRK